MEIIKADINDFGRVKNITHDTIKEIYPRYYPKGAVDFFLSHHSKDNITEDLNNGRVYLIKENGEYIATVTINDNEINRFFVLPHFQGMGYGSMILDFVERKILEKFDSVHIDASFPAVSLYLKRGYEYTSYHKLKTENGDYLCYSEMQLKNNNREYKMRRKDNEITDINLIDEIICKCDCIRIALNDKDRPYIVPLNFGYEVRDSKRYFYCHGAKEGRKIDLIKENKYAGFELDTNHKLHENSSPCGYSFGYQSIIGTGKISIIENEKEKIHGLKIIMKHNSGKEDRDFDKKMIEAVSVIKIIVEELSCKEHE
ncbi:GNAT family N-acetyltransferase [uncultured Anaerofustis sp.]|uniref:GNAT family N-acetyltransferase n=1 Tax=uncultured Anaerofustis sp. TaxID=904996 RepID=UPI0025EF74E8|nr:GNAT family N-acetyltransferase [uncultured Anaerofustis sp.]